MGVDQKYGQVTVEKVRLAPIGEDEPVFVLRAQDPLAAEAVRQYADLCDKHRTQPEHVASCLDAADVINEWQRNNPDKVRTLPGMLETEV